MEFSRQDYWKVKVKVTQSCPTLCDPTDYTVHGILQARILEWVAFPFFRVPSQPKDQTQVSRMQEDSLPAEQGKPKNTGAGSLSLLQGIFSTQESTRGLLQSRRILYQLSYQGSPLSHHFMINRRVYRNLFWLKKTLLIRTKKVTSEKHCLENDRDSLLYNTAL